MGHFRERTHFSTASFQVEFNPVMWCYYSCLFFWFSWLFATSVIFSASPQPGLKTASNMYWVFTYYLHIHSSVLRAWAIMPNASLSAFIHLISSPLNRFFSDQSKWSSVSFSRRRGREKLNCFTARVLLDYKQKHFIFLSGTPTKSVLGLFISIHSVNGFSIANYLQNLYQDTFCSCMMGPSVHNTWSVFGLHQQVSYLKEYS